MAERRLLLGVTGSIAAYKVPWLIRELQRHQWSVRVAMTPAAAAFVSPTTLQNLTGMRVSIDPFADALQELQSWHIHWAQWADLMLIAPCTLTTLAKLAVGIADTTVTLLAFSLPPSVPLACAPAMDAEMWQHPVTSLRVKELEQRGVRILPPEVGELASGLKGPGRLPEIERIVKFVEQVWQQRSGSTSDMSTPRDLSDEMLERPVITLDDRVEQRQFEVELEWTTLKRQHSVLKDKVLLITAGPTYEPIDPVRFIGNFSTGTMGYALAEEAVRRRARVILVSGPTTLEPPKGAEVYRVQTAEEMYAVVLDHWPKADIFVGAAAVADFTPVASQTEKIKKQGQKELVVRLKPTPDILAAVGAQKKSHQIVIGFALETHNGVAAARQKLQQKRCDLIVLNYANRPRSGFGSGDNTITLISPQEVKEYPPMSKQQCAQQILDEIENIMRHRLDNER